MQYIEAPHTETPKHKSVFLAGGITNCPNWQKEVAGALKDLEITIFNPRRKNFPIHDRALAREQIEWEYERLRQADILSFWFSEGSLNPIVLFELGGALERALPMVLGIHPEYPRKQDVEIQTALKKPGVIPYYSLKELAENIRKIFMRL